MLFKIPTRHTSQYQLLTILALIFVITNIIMIIIEKRINSFMPEQKDKIKKIYYIVGIICSIVIASAILYNTFFPSTTVVVQEPLFQEPLIKSNISAVYSIDRIDTTEICRLDVTNIGEYEAEMLSINIIFPENMSIFDLKRFYGGQRMGGEDGGINYNYYDILYGWINSNETLFVELYLNNIDGDFIVGETWIIEPDIKIWVSGKQVIPTRES